MAGKILCLLLCTTAVTWAVVAKPEVAPGARHEVAVVQPGIHLETKMVNGRLMLAVRNTGDLKAVVRLGEKIVQIAVIPPGGEIRLNLPPAGGRAKVEVALEVEGNEVPIYSSVLPLGRAGLKAGPIWLKGE